MKQKRKRDPLSGEPGGRSSIPWKLPTVVLIIGFVCGLCVLPGLSVITRQGTPIPPPTPILPDVPERLVVPFDRVEPTYTERLYSHTVLLRIEGTGQASGSAYSDAFYLYTDTEGNPLETPETEMFDLEIDGDRAIVTLGLLNNPPPYSPDHIYYVYYDAGMRVRRIAFRISDSTVGDNTGQFTIEVSPLR